MPLSYSQLSTYRTCPRQYEFANVKKIPRKISAGESFGSSVHNTLAKFGREEMKHQRLNTKNSDDQLKLFVDDHDVEISNLKYQIPNLTADSLVEFWHQSFITEGYASKVDADRARIKGERIMEHFFEWWSRREREVVAIEEGFRVEAPIINNQLSNDEGVVTLRGRFDRIERIDGKLNVIDFKTSAPRTQEQVDEDLQLSLYALAVEYMYGEPCSELQLLFLREDGVTSVSTKRTESDLQKAKDIISSVGHGIEHHVFKPIPSEAVCSRCPYRNICDAAV